MDRLTIEETQRLVDEWIHTVGGGYFSELTNMAVLTEEVGELARVISRVYGDQVAKEGDLRKGLAEESPSALSNELAHTSSIIPKMLIQMLL